MARLPARSLALHILRIKGVAEPEALVEATGSDVGELEKVLAGLAGSGLVERRSGVLAGWRLTTAGIAQDDAWLARELDAAGSRAGVEHAFRSFLALNPDLLAACTAWQLVAGGDGILVPNDHGDESYDAAVVALLADIHRRAQPVLLALASALPRFGHYRRRLQRALDGVQDGDGNWFTRPLLDSYHQVWFELHQDLLHTLGLERGHEGDAEMAPTDEHEPRAHPG